MVTASGQITWDASLGPGVGTVGPKGTWFTPERLEPARKKEDQFPDQSAPCGSLLMRVGSFIYFVGEKNEIAIQMGGRDEGDIEFMINDRYGWLQDNNGFFDVKVQKRVTD